MLTFLFSHECADARAQASPLLVVCGLLQLQHTEHIYFYFIFSLHYVTVT